MKIKNPIVDGWYADPEARKYGDKYYVYVTGGDITVFRQTIWLTGKSKAVFL